MENRIRAYIDGLFSRAPRTKRAEEMKEELWVHAMDKYRDLLSRGYSDESAYQAVISGMGDVNELLRALGPEPAPNGGQAASGAAFSPPPPKKRSSAPMIVLVSAIVLIFLLAIIGLCRGAAFWGNSVGAGLAHINAAHADAPFDGTVARDRVDLSEDVNRLEINWLGGTIRVMTHDASTIAFAQTSSGSIAENRLLRYKLNGGRLELNEGEFCSFNGLQGTTDLTIWLPQNAELKAFSLNNASALFTAENLNAGQVEINTASGEIRLNGITAESLEANAASGNIEGRNLACDETDIVTVSGSIDLEGALMDVDCSIVSGSTRFAFTNTPRRVTVEAVSGDVTVLLPKSAGYAASLESLSGRITTDRSDTVTDGEVVFGDGSAKIKATSVSGGLRIGINEKAE